MVLIFEGADGLGKTTIARIIGKILGWEVVSQPNPNNILGFIREEVKYKKYWDMVERQLLHTCSHLVDYLTIKSSVVFDRSWISTWVYSRVFGVDESKLKVIIDINRKVFEQSFKEYKVFIFSGDKPKKTEKEDLYENLSDWKMINLYYLMSVELLDISDYKIINVSNKSISEVTLEVARSLPSIVIDIYDFLGGFTNDKEKINEILWMNRVVPGTMMNELEDQFVLKLVKELEE